MKADTHLGGQTLEEGRHALLANHVLDDLRAAGLRAKVGVLNPGLGRVSFTVQLATGNEP